jgi:hypothetical protein
VTHYADVLVLLENRRLLAWDYFHGKNKSQLWDPCPPETTIERGAVDWIWCSGLAPLVDGRLFAPGGPHITDPGPTSDKTNVFDPSDSTWASGPVMADGRHYPTATLLGDGRVLIVKGHKEKVDGVEIPNDVPEVFLSLDSGQSHLARLPDADTGGWSIGHLYPKLLLAPNGDVFYGGQEILKLDTFRWTWWSYGTDPDDGAIPDNETSAAVLYRPDRVLKCGGAIGQNDTSLTAIDDVAYADIGNIQSDLWVRASDMLYARGNHHLVVLPDGKVLAVGGYSLRQGQQEPYTYTHVLAAELWDPDTDTWTEMASMTKGRSHHATAILLPDGRVFVAGGEGSGNDSPPGSGTGLNSYEIFWPPYLFDASAQLAPRPHIDSFPSEVSWGETMNVAYSNTATPVASACLIRPGAVTHSFDQNMRYVPLSIFSQAYSPGTQSGTLVLKGLLGSNWVPPGPYLLFVVNEDGVPSFGEFVRVVDRKVAFYPVAYTVVAGSEQGSGNLEKLYQSDNARLVVERVTANPDSAAVWVKGSGPKLGAENDILELHFRLETRVSDQQGPRSWSYRVEFWDFDAGDYVTVSQGSVGFSDQVTTFKVTSKPARFVDEVGGGASWEVQALVVWKDTNQSSSTWYAGTDEVRWWVRMK